MARWPSSRARCRAGWWSANLERPALLVGALALAQQIDPELRLERPT
jgi:hypothetical protein